MDSIRIKVERLILIASVAFFLVLYLSSTSGVFFFIVLALVWTSILLFLKYLRGFFKNFQPKKATLINLSLLVTCLLATLILVESFLWIYQLNPKVRQRIDMP